MPRPLSPGRPARAAALALLLTAPVVGRAQASAADSAARARRVAGSARVALDGGTTRLDGGEINEYQLGAAAYPFVGEHLQLGVASSYDLGAGSNTPTYRSYSGALTTNYVVGGGARWRGYAGAYAARTWNRLDSFTGRDFTNPGFSQAYGQVGAQAGALYFLNPALAVRAELRLRRPTEGDLRPTTTQVLVRLDPYLFGRAGDGAPAPAGFGVVDVDGYATRTDLPYDRSHGWGAGVTAAPYLTRWAQLGVVASGSRFSDFGGNGVYVARGFGRLYLPFTVRTQPFVEGFVQTGTYADVEDGHLYGGTLGVRQLLSARVALDAGVRRQRQPREVFDGVELSWPGETRFVLGLATRVGRAR